LEGKYLTDFGLRETPGNAGLRGGSGFVAGEEKPADDPEGDAEPFSRTIVLSEVSGDTPVATTACCHYPITVDHR
jgi:hypothetical protein